MLKNVIVGADADRLRFHGPRRPASPARLPTSAGVLCSSSRSRASIARGDSNFIVDASRQVADIPARFHVQGRNAGVTA